MRTRPRWPKGKQRKPELDRIGADGQPERFCSKCDLWHPLARFSANKTCVGGRGYICKTCTWMRIEEGKMRREEEQALRNQKRRIGAGLLRLRKAVTGESERKAG